jgi:excinuclease UvrABC nuclease subunit
LIDYFGSFEAIRKAEIDDLALVVGIKKANIIKIDDKK